MGQVMYMILIIASIGVIIAANIQRKKDGKFNQRSKKYLDIGIVAIVYSLAVKIPEYIRYFLDLFSH